jgi:hypothetical protein
MNGQNELHLCTAEMLVAIQEYLNKRMLSYAPTAAYVTVTGLSSAQTFVISLKAKDTPDA